MGIVDDDASYGLDQSAVADIVNTDGVQGSVSVASSAIEAKVGASRLEYRKLLTVHNDGPNIVYWGYTSAVTSSTGTPLYRNQLATWTIGDGLGIWLVSATGTNTVRVTEAS